MAPARVPELPGDLGARLATGLVLLGVDLNVAWLNDAMADLLEVGVRGLRGQSLAAVLPAGDDMLAVAARRLRDGEPAIAWRGVPLITLNGHARPADIAMQSLGADTWLLEVHALGTAGTAPTPLWATLRGVAHEVKNPLAGLRGAAQLLARRVADDDARALATLILGEADRLAALTDRLLAHDGGAHLTTVNLHALLERARQLSAAGVMRIDVDYDPSLPDVTGDADRLQQVLHNLVRNAVEAGATRVTLRTRVAHQVPLGVGTARTTVRVDVIDDGPGVPETVRGQLFQPMVSGRPDGTGLGLALALETARDHGGDLQHARTAEGTVFSLYLPLDRGRDTQP